MAHDQRLQNAFRNLPYSYQARDRLYNDVQMLLQHIPSLRPEVSTFGSGPKSVQLFHLCGTVPITFSGATYNIPVTLYFDPPYPNSAPRCFVTPSEGMALKSGHQNVDQGGMIYMPYLSSWDPRSSSLQQLVQAIQQAFSISPPVYSTGGQRPPQPQQQQQRPMATAVATPVQQQQHMPVAVAKAVAKPTLTAKERAVNAVEEQAIAQWPKVLGPIIDDINAQNRRKAELQVKADAVDAEVKRLIKEKNEADAKEAELGQIQEQMQAFIEANKGKEPDPNVLKEQLDPDARLALELLSEQLALEEYRDSLDQLLGARKINVDDFLREVRDATREEFKLKVQRKKAVETQRNMAIARGLAAPDPPAAGYTAPAAPAAPVAVQAVPVQGQPVPVQGLPVARAKAVAA